MKALFAQEYIGRVLFVLEHNDKYITVYRSSGLSGTGHANQILPFSSLQTRNIVFNSINIGYIHKEMYYDGSWVYHGKDLTNFPSVDEKMQYLQYFLSHFKPSMSFDYDNNKIEGTNDFDHTAWKQYVNTTMHAINTAIGKLTPFDLSQDF